MQKLLNRIACIGFVWLMVFQNGAFAMQVDNESCIEELSLYIREREKALDLPKNIWEVETIALNILNATLELADRLYFLDRNNVPVFDEYDARKMANGFVDGTIVFLQKRFLDQFPYIQEKLRKLVELKELNNRVLLDDDENDGAENYNKPSRYDTNHLCNTIKNLHNVNNKQKEILIIEDDTVPPFVAQRESAVRSDLQESKNSRDEAITQAHQNANKRSNIYSLMNTDEESHDSYLAEYLRKDKENTAMVEDVEMLHYSTDFVPQNQTNNQEGIVSTGEYCTFAEDENHSEEYNDLNEIVAAVNVQEKKLCPCNTAVEACTESGLLDHIRTNHSIKLGGKSYYKCPVAFCYQQCIRIRDLVTHIQKEHNMCHSCGVCRKLLYSDEIEAHQRQCIEEHDNVSELPYWQSDNNNRIHNNDQSFVTNGNDVIDDVGVSESTECTAPDTAVSQHDLACENPTLYMDFPVLTLDGQGQGDACVDTNYSYLDDLLNDEECDNNRMHDDQNFIANGDGYAMDNVSDYVDNQAAGYELEEEYKCANTGVVIEGEKNNEQEISFCPCNKTRAKSYNSILQHVKLYHRTGTGEFFCSLCSETFSSEGRLLRHGKKEHNIYHWCARCKKLLHADEIDAHTNECIRKECFCPCNKAKAKSFQVLYGHIKRLHRTVNGEYCCSLCSETFRSVDKLLEHGQRQHNIYHWCAKCKKLLHVDEIDAHTNECLIVNSRNKAIHDATEDQQVEDNGFNGSDQDNYQNIIVNDENSMNTAVMGGEDNMLPNMVANQQYVPQSLAISVDNHPSARILSTWWNF